MIKAHPNKSATEMICRVQNLVICQLPIYLALIEVSGTLVHHIILILGMFSLLLSLICFDLRLKATYFHFLVYLQMFEMFFWMCTESLPHVKCPHFKIVVKNMNPGDTSTGQKWFLLKGKQPLFTLE